MSHVPHMWSCHTCEWVMSHKRMSHVTHMNESRHTQQGSDGYHRHWKGYGQIYTGPIHEGKYGGKDYLQIQDLVTGEVEYFRFRFT